MSYILEALKKADRERNLGDVPDLEAAHWGVRKVSSASRWPWVVAVLLLFNAVLLLYLFGRDTPGISDQAETGDHASTDAPARTTQAATEPLQRLDIPVRETPREMRPKVQLPAPAVVTAQPDRAVARPDRAPQVVKSNLPLSAGEAESQLPEWGELPLEFRSSFALPHIDVHVYAEESARRFVLIDLQKYREGDTLSTGAVLEKIGAGSIQLFYQGTRFRVDR
ncbi:MAG TPA: general secretion pathway protein GspB [Gammaproteobacteria bacterium]|nr:general secretion pathway protein GspB [Gammaproteobacteria bacterium]